MVELRGYILGTLGTTEWIALFFFFLLGASIYQYTKARKGQMNKAGSPDRFSLSYYVKDFQNWTDFVVSILSAYLFVRFGSSLLQPELFENFELLLLASVGLGASWQLLADKLLDKVRK
jgi:hypothetical protein